MIVIEIVAGLLLCLGSYLVIRAVRAADVDQPTGDQGLPATEAPPRHQRAA